MGAAVAGLVPLAPGDPLPDQPGTLLAVPLFHVTGLHASFLSSYRTQRRMVCMYRWDAQAAAALIDAKRLTSMVVQEASPGTWVDLRKARPKT